MMTSVENNNKGWMDRFVSSPSAMATILIALVGQAAFSIVYQIVNNEQQAAQIELGKVAITTLRSEIVNLQTPLSSIVLKLESRVSAIESDHKNMEARMTASDAATTARVDAIDRSGTRGLDALVTTTKRNSDQLDRLAERAIMQDKKLNEFELRSITQIQSQLDQFKLIIQRVEEQQGRIIQALDSMYATQTEMLRSIPKPPAKRQ